jgi:hypothetical protein
MLNFVYLRSSRLQFLHFGLDSCIVNKGEKSELVLGYWMHLERFQVVSSHFWALCVTGLTGHGHRSDWSKGWFCSHVENRSDRWLRPVWPVRAELMQLLCFHQVICIYSSRGSCIGSRELACVQGFSSFGLVVCALCLSIVLSRLCRTVALA